MLIGMKQQRTAIVALAAAGALWGLTVPLSKLGLEWLGAGWLAVARFAIAAPLLALVARGRLRTALTPSVALAGAVGYGGRDPAPERRHRAHERQPCRADRRRRAGARRRSSLRCSGRGSSGAPAWAGALVALAGVGLVAGGGGAGTTLAGDLLVLLSVTGSASFIVFQPGLLAGRDPAAVTAVQLGAAGLASLPVALVLEGAPPAPTGAEPVVAVLALALTGTALAFWLFAWAQARVPAAVAGAFVNLEPLVGALTGAVAFHDARRARAARGRRGDPGRDRPRPTARWRKNPSSGSVAAQTMAAARGRSGQPAAAGASASMIAGAFSAAFEADRMCASGDAPRSRPRVSRSALGATTSRRAAERRSTARG